MSAIWGIISKKSDNTDINNKFNKMTASMSVFSFDRIDTTNHDNCCFACGHQYYTNEDSIDISPFYDKNTGIIFCSDCFLYNRDSLITELNDNTLITAGDSQIAFAAFTKWGYSFVEKLRGYFSFAIYDESTSDLHLFSDHFSNKYLAYYNNPDYVCFSSVYKPILACLGNDIKINHEFIANCYTDISPRNFYKESITPFENIFHLDYATHLTINTKTGKEIKKRYWNPRHTVKKLKLKSDNDYKVAFRTLLDTLTRSMLRSKDETGIFLSGGLDSSAITAFAAPIQKEKNKKLFSYTFVPSSDYKSSEEDPSRISDETPLVQMQKALHPNLVTRFINGDNDCCVSDLDYFQNLYDIPVKPSINHINIIDISKEAHKDNCSVIISGGHGNGTISYGYLNDYVSLNISRLHFIKALKEILFFCKCYKISRKKLIGKYIKILFNYLFQKPEEDHLFLKEEDERKYGLTHPNLDDKHINGNGRFTTPRQRYNFLVCPMQFIHKGIYYTNFGLMNHFIMVDPTQTVEMVEFCMSLPLECLVHNGLERRLVRGYLKDLLPEPVTSMHKGYGVQSADFNYRVNRDFDIHKENVFRNLDEPLLREYLDAKKIDPLINELKAAAEAHNLDQKQCIKLTLLASLGGFLRDHTK